MTLLQRYTLHRSKYKSPHLPTTLREFVDACIARQNECDNLHSRLQASGRGPLPGNWGDFQNVEHSHLYFGARRFWTDPWDCEPGFEHLCADPISDSGIEAFISTCLARPQSSRNYLSAPSSEHLQPLQEMASSGNTFTRLPREMLDLIISYLSLLDALSLYSTSRNLVMLSDSRFWRFQTIQLHGCWFWELRDHLESSSNDNWKALLQMLEINYFKIQQGAEPYWLSSTTVSENDGKTHGAARRRAEITLVPLPLGLANRQRIWMCLEGVGTKADWETKEDQPERSGRRNRRHRKSRLTG